MSRYPVYDGKGLGYPPNPETFPPAGQAAGLMQTLGRNGILSVGPGAMAWYITRPILITAVLGYVGIAPSGADIIIDMNIFGITLYTNQTHRLTISDGNQSSGFNVPDIVSLNIGGPLTLDIDQVGGPAFQGQDLSVTIQYNLA